MQWASGPHLKYIMSMKSLRGGDIYNVENMLILTPKRHLDIHKGAK